MNLLLARFSQPLLIALSLALGLTSAISGANAADIKAASGSWIKLAGNPASAVWRSDHEGWTAVSDVSLDPAEERRLRGKPGSGILLSAGNPGTNLLTRDEFQDLELKLEFLIPRGTNSGVKFNGLYEIQIRDTHDAKSLTGDDCGGIYPRAKLGNPYRLLDNGVAPRTNAARPAGQWQTLEIAFTAPRFDDAGKKTTNARFLRVVLNGKTIHKDAELKWPTGAAWNTSPEIPRGPLLLQGDHGPIAFRHVTLRPLSRQPNAQAAANSSSEQEPEAPARDAQPKP